MKSISCQEGGENVDKRNVILASESWKALVAKKGGDNFDKTKDQSFSGLLWALSANIGITVLTLRCRVNLKLKISEFGKNLFAEPRAGRPAAQLDILPCPSDSWTSNDRPRSLLVQASEGQGLWNTQARRFFLFDLSESMRKGATFCSWWI